MAEKSRRIIVFTTAFRPLIGGSEIALERIIQRLPDVFFDVITVRFLRLKKNDRLGSNCHIHRVGFGGRFGKMLFPVFGFIKALQLLSAGNCRLIHAYQASFGGAAAWLLKIFRPELIFVLTLQEGKNLSGQNMRIKYFRELILKKADIITSISNYLNEFALSVNPAAKTRVIPNGVEVENFKNAKIDESIYGKLNVKREDRIVISVSRLVEKNGLACLIDAMVGVKKEFPTVKLFLAGSGPLMETLKRQTAENALDGTVIFLGELENNRIPAILKMADVFVRPSLSEGLGISFLEAMAAGVPIVAPLVGGIKDFLKDDQTGLVCQPGDPKSVAVAILRILTDRQLKENIRSQALALVEEKYDWNIIAAKFGELYRTYGV